MLYKSLFNNVHSVCFIHTHRKNSESRKTSTLGHITLEVKKQLMIKVIDVRTHLITRFRQSRLEFLTLLQSKTRACY